MMRPIAGERAWFAGLRCMQRSNSCGGSGEGEERVARNDEMNPARGKAGQRREAKHSNKLVPGKGMGICYAVMRSMRA